MEVDINLKINYISIKILRGDSITGLFVNLEGLIGREEGSRAIGEDEEHD